MSTAKAPAPRPLDGLRILDLTSVVMGPYASSILADMGADVIKVESPEGDILRQVGPSRSGAAGGMFLHANRGKRGIVLDLKSKEGRAAALKLVETVDVLFYNLRPSAMERLGLTYEAVAERNPAIIYVGAFGFGRDGRYADQPAYDDLIQGLAAIPALLAQAGDGTPRYVPVNIADRIVGLHAAIAILGAVHFRSRTGLGQSIDVPMFETMASMVLADHMAGLSYDPPLDAGGYRRLLTPERRPYRTADGHLCVVIYTDQHWQRFLKIAGRDDLVGDPRFATHATRLFHIEEITREVAAILATRETAAWQEVLGKADIPNAVMHTIETLVEDGHLQDVGFFTPSMHPSEGRVTEMTPASRWSISQPQASRPAPALGEHNAEVAAEMEQAKP